MAGPPDDEQRCVGAAGDDCAAARACLYDASHPSLCGFGEAPRCDGTVAVACQQQITMTSRTDCSLVGETCVAGSTAALCAFGSCSDPPSARFCRGTVAGYCASTFLVGTDCSGEGAHCTPPDQDGGAARCTGDGASCITDGCLDARTFAPCLDLHRGTVPCRPGERCFPMSAKVGHAACGLGGDCDPNSYFDNCLGGVLHFCRRGLEETIDCRALGFPDCTTSPSSGCSVTIRDAGAGPALPDGPVM